MTLAGGKKKKHNDDETDRHVKQLFAAQEVPFDIHKILENKDKKNNNNNNMEIQEEKDNTDPNVKIRKAMVFRRDKDSNNNNNNGNDDVLGRGKFSHFSTMDDALTASDNKPPADRASKVIRKRFRDKPYGVGVDAERLVIDGRLDQNDNDSISSHPDPDNVLKAFLEPIDWKGWWHTKPLPIRNTTAEKLVQVPYPKLRSCSKLPEQWPVDNYPDQDPFLPWIHDVFPTHDGKFIQFVAQNKRKCNSGVFDPNDDKIVAWTQPQAALFQHVPVKRISSTSASSTTTRYVLTDHDDADQDGEVTRFICRFKQPKEGRILETLSVFNFDYDFATYIRRHKYTFAEFEAGIKSVHTSQLLFKCPVPNELVDIVQSGSSVKDDWATMFLDLIPIRTPVRYGPPHIFFQNYYKEERPRDKSEWFDPNKEWGEHHILPKIEDSGRWENIPICKTSLDTYYNEDDENNKNINNNLQQQRQPEQRVNDDEEDDDNKPDQKHRLVACLWVSAGYSTRGNRFAINDGQRRLVEWMHYNQLIGFEHFYIYDNSLAHMDAKSTTLKPIVELEPFQNITTYIPWPSKICNNRPNNVDSPGHRSSQYAAESSCRLRFGPHVEWIGQFDIDEYIVPMGNYDSVPPLLDQLDQEGMRILSFGSWRSWPRRDLIERPKKITDSNICEAPRPCFDLRIPLHNSVVQTYNCDRGPEKKVMPAEKQIYKANYVLQHFIHYSTVTALSVLNKEEWNANAQGKERDFFTDIPYHRRKFGFRQAVFPDPRSRFVDEANEGTMIHTKAIAIQDTTDWLSACKVNISSRYTCRVGVPRETKENYDIDNQALGDKDGWKYNCYVNSKLENYFVPRLDKVLKEKHGDMSLGK